MFCLSNFLTASIVYSLIFSSLIITVAWIVDCLPSVAKIKLFIIHLFNNWFFNNAATMAAMSLLVLAIIQTVDVVYSIYRLNYEYELLTRPQANVANRPGNNDTNTNESPTTVKNGCS